MEVFWFVVAIVTAIYGFFKIREVGIENNYLLVIMPFIAAGMSFFRRYVRLRGEKNNPES